MWFWFRAFLFTQIVECPIYMRGLRCPLWAAFGASALTHPIVWFVFPALWPGGYLSMLFGAELFAWAAETIWLKANRVERAALWSFIANAASFCIGMALRGCFGVP